MNNELKVYNKFGKEVNILHFQGNNLEQFKRTSQLIFDLANLDPLEDNLSIVMCWTDDEKCILLQQLIKNQIPFTNALPGNYNYLNEWDMRNKIKYYIECLENDINTDIVLLLDGYDVLFVSTKDIVKKFLSQPYRILFNSTVNNFPNVHIDTIPNRLQYERFSPFFNAGCCIGYREDLIKFYKECYELIDIPNELNSEQFIVRHAFANYSYNPEQRFVWIDFKRDIFNSMGYMSCEFNCDTMTLNITDNLLVPKNQRDAERISGNY